MLLCNNQSIESNKKVIDIDINNVSNSKIKKNDLLLMLHYFYFKRIPVQQIAENVDNILNLAKLYMCKSLVSYLEKKKVHKSHPNK